MNPVSSRIELSFASKADRASIYDIRYQVYASELGQHSENEYGMLTDKLDAVNYYIVAKLSGQIVGFVSVTPPNSLGYSIDKYFGRENLPLIFDQNLYEIRLLTVVNKLRGSRVGALLCYAALCLIVSLKGKMIVAIGRLEILDLYFQAGMKSLDRQVRSGKVTYELLVAATNDIRKDPRLQKLFSYLEMKVIWKLDGVSFLKNDCCYHGGAFFEALDDEFADMQKKENVINADVLDAWFDPAPGVLEAIYTHLPWSLKTSPPTGSEGMCRLIARNRGVKEENILPGAGSSDLIFLGLRQLLNMESRVLILDPMYGEYAHILENVIGCRVDRFTLSRLKNYAIQPDELTDCLRKKYDLVILVNPNSPTGQYFSTGDLKQLIETTPETTCFWIDETYLEFIDPEHSLEHFAAGSENVIICKSMSKVYALSGVRCAYLCGPELLINDLRRISPPWSVSLPGQIAACEAMRNISYYRRKWEETRLLRESFAMDLKNLDWDVIPGCANFLLCHLPPDQPEASTLISACQKQNLYLRDASNMGRSLDNRTLRIAVKDSDTNAAMIRILKSTLSGINPTTIESENDGF